MCCAVGLYGNKRFDLIWYDIVPTIINKHWPVTSCWRYCQVFKEAVSRLTRLSLSFSSHERNPPRLLSNNLKQFCNWSSIRREFFLPITYTVYCKLKISCFDCIVHIWTVLLCTPSKGKAVKARPATFGKVKKKPQKGNLWIWWTVQSSRGKLCMIPIHTDRQVPVGQECDCWKPSPSSSHPLLPPRGIGIRWMGIDNAWWWLTGGRLDNPNSFPDPNQGGIPNHSLIPIIPYQWSKHSGTD